MRNTGRWRSVSPVSINSMMGHILPIRLFPAALPATLAANTGEVSSEAAISFATSQYYLSRETNNNTKLVGWYPRAVPAAGVVTLNIDGGTDIMLTQELEGCKVAESRFGHGRQGFHVRTPAYAIQVQSLCGRCRSPGGLGEDNRHRPERPTAGLQNHAARYGRVRGRCRRPVSVEEPACR